MYCIEFMLYVYKEFQANILSVTQNDFIPNLTKKGDNHRYGHLKILEIISNELVGIWYSTKKK